jgi:3-oxoacyl-[acyl-carrier protein] reductase
MSATHLHEVNLSDSRTTSLPSDLLRDQVAIVTGASRGIGRATAVRLAQGGAHVLLSYYRNQEAAEEVACSVRRLGRTAITVCADAGDPGFGSALTEVALARFGRVDILVANAGIWEGARVEQMSDELWERVTNVNLRGTFTAVRAAVPPMKQRGSGSIVIVSSTAGQRGEAGYSNYAASKGAQISFAKSLAVELAPAIRVNCVAPGWVDTEMNVPVFGAGNLANPLNGDRTKLCYRRAVEATIPLRHIAAPDDIAVGIAFLASHWSRHITGEVLNINGGSVLCG